MSRITVLQQYYARLSRLESDREELRIQGDKDEAIALIDVEMKFLRSKLQTVMNSPCPLLKGDN